MRVSVDAVVIIRRGGEHLEKALQGLTSQSRPVDRVCLVDASADSTIQSSIDAGLSGPGISPEVIAVPYGTQLADVLEDALDHLYPGGPIPENQWVWLLRDDVTAHPEALGQMVLTIEGAPTVKIAGPKQRMADSPQVIRELGETMSRFGERMALAERELDQAQYDRLSDVLAVGEAGMLVHAATLRDLGGFDHSLSPLDGGLDLGIRARLAGHRVVAIPRAVVSVGSGPADWHYGKDISALHQRFLARRAWLYRRFVYAPAWALVLLLVWALPWSLVRGVTHVLAKHPDRLVTEVMAALWALGKIGDVLGARSRVNQTRVASWSSIDSLRMAPPDVARRRSIAREAARADAEEKAHLQPRPSVFPALPWLILALAGVAGLIHGRWWGAETLLGGGLLPLGGAGDGLWSAAWSTTPTTLGFDAASIPADPALLIFAALGSLTWWSPGLAVTALFIGSIPLAGAIAWWGASQVLSRAWTTSLVAGAWALAPTFLTALAEGRIGAVIAHLFLPWLVGAALTAHESWQRVGQLSLATLVVTAAAPVLWPAIVVGVVLLGLVRVWGSPFRMFAGVLPLALGPSLVLAFPRFIAWWESVGGRWWDDWGVLLADPGRAVPFVAGEWWQVAAGWPSGFSSAASALSIIGLSSNTVSIVLVVAAGLVLALAVASLPLGRIVAAAAFAALFALGLLTAVTAPVLFSGYEGFEQVRVWPGTGVSVMVLGVLLGAGATLDRVDFEDALGNTLNKAPHWLTRAGAAALATTVVTVAIPFALSAWSGATLVQSATAPRTLPALVAAEAATNPRIGTLVIAETQDGFDVSLERGSGQTLMDSSTLVRARSTELSQRDEDLARAVASLVRSSAADPTEVLQEYGIRFIWLKADAASPAALMLAQRPELTSASSAEAGQLWQTSVSLPAVAPKPVESGNQALFWLVTALAVLFAIPTERRSRGGQGRTDDALPTLGEETSDDD